MPKSKRAIALNNPRRGKNFERECVKMAEGYGLPARRAWGSNGEALGLDRTVDVTVGKYTFQCKRVKRLPQNILPNQFNNGQLIREDGGEPFVVIQFEMLLLLLSALREHAPWLIYDKKNTDV